MQTVSSNKSMTYIDNIKLNETLKKVSDLGIDINTKQINVLLNNLNLYQTDIKNPEYPFYLTVRELGKWTDKTYHGVDEPLSKNVLDIVFESYFSEWDKQTLNYIMSEINRITDNLLDYRFISETKYVENEDIVFEFEISGNFFKLICKDTYSDGSLDDSFIIKELLPILKPFIKKGHLLYVCDSSINMVFLKEQTDADNFLKEISYARKI